MTRSKSELENGLIVLHFEKRKREKSSTVESKISAKLICSIKCCFLYSLIIRMDFDLSVFFFINYCIFISFVHQTEKKERNRFQCIYEYCVLMIFDSFTNCRLHCVCFFHICIKRILICCNDDSCLFLVYECFCNIRV